MGVEVFTDLERAIADVDVIMMLRLQLERQQAGLFELRANTACELALPGRAVSASADEGKTWRPLAGRTEGGQVVVPVSATDLAAAQVWLKVEP